MTINKEHGIKVAPSMKFLVWLKTIDKHIEFYVVFVVPSDIASDYEKQTLKTLKNTIYLNPKSDVKMMKQYIFGLDLYLDVKKVVNRLST